MKFQNPDIPLLLAAKDLGWVVQNSVYLALSCLGVKSIFDVKSLLDLTEGFNAKIN
jgi:hypothetical protein